jgi:hypothetical protein
MTTPGVSRTRTLAVLLILLAVLVKALVAARLELFGDEAFYWVSSRRPAFWIVPRPGLLPPLTPMLVTAGVALFGSTTFGVRAAFLLIGLALPFVVYRIALGVATFILLGAGVLSA